MADQNQVETFDAEKSAKLRKENPKVAAAFDNILKNYKNTKNKVDQHAIDSWNKARSIDAKTWKMAKDIANKTKNKVDKYAADGINKAKDIDKKNFKKAKKFYKKAENKVNQFAADGVNKAKDIANNTYNKTKKLYKDTENKVNQFAIDGINNAKDIVKNTFDDTDINQNNQVTGGWGSTRGGTPNATNNNQITGGWGSTTGANPNYNTKNTNGANNEVLETVQNKASDAWDAISDSVSSAGKWIGSLFEKKEEPKPEPVNIPVINKAAINEVPFADDRKIKATRAESSGRLLKKKLEERKLKKSLVKQKQKLNLVDKDTDKNINDLKDMIGENPEVDPTLDDKINDTMRELDAMDYLQEYSDGMKNKKADTDLSWFLGYVDSETGTNLLKGYKPPTTQEELDKQALGLNEILYKRKEQKLKDLINLKKILKAKNDNKYQNLKTLTQARLNLNKAEYYSKGKAGKDADMTKKMYQLKKLIQSLETGEVTKDIKKVELLRKRNPIQDRIMTANGIEDRAQYEAFVQNQIEKFVNLVKNTGTLNEVKKWNSMNEREQRAHVIGKLNALAIKKLAEYKGTTKAIVEEY